MAKAVTVRLAGGLGNQMFQHAAARAVGARLGMPVAHDLRFFSRNTQRQPAVQRFQVQARQATPMALARYPTPLLRAAGRAGRVVQLACGIFREASFRFDVGVHAIGGPVHMSGDFQSERYFADLRSALLQEFMPVAMPRGENARLVELVTNAPAASVHVRRGDYVTSERNRQIYSRCSHDYYQRAMACISTAGNPEAWLVFSDDLPWARRHIHPPGPTSYVDGNVAQPELDIYLMSLCKHNICANSSFSWWGAWLNRHPDKIVVAPARWFEPAGPDASDLVPRQWLRLAN